MSDFEEFRRWRAAKIHEQLGRKLDAEFDAEGIDEEQLLQEMEEIRKEVYQEAYGSKSA